MIPQFSLCSQLLLGKHLFSIDDNLTFLMHLMKSSGECFTTMYHQQTQKVWTIYLTETTREATYMVLHIWRGHLHTYAYIHCLINEMNRLISLFHRRPNTRLLERPCNEKFEAHKVEITLFLSQNSKHKLPFTAYRWHDLAIPCLPLLSFLCLFSFQLLHSLVLLALMLVRPIHKSTQLTKPVES